LQLKLTEKLMFLKMKKVTGINCIIHKTTKIGKNVKFGNNITIYPHVTIEDNVHIWDNCVIGRIPMGVKSIIREISTSENTIIRYNSIIGCGCIIYSGAVIGKDNIIGDNSVIRENVIFEDDVIIGFNTTISYNVLIGRGTRVLQQSAVSAFSVIGEDNFISIGYTSVSDKYFKDKGFSENSSKGPVIGNGNNIGPHVTIISNIEIGDNNTIGAHALVTKNIGSNGIYYGVPAKLIKTKSV